MGGLVRIWAVIILAAVVLEGCDKPPPGDAKLIETFKAQRSTFKILRERLCRLPSAQTVWTDTDHSDPPLSDQDRDRWLRLMRKIGATRIAVLPKGRVSKECFVEITFWSAGFLDSGDSKSIEFQPMRDSDALVLKSLDNIDFKRTVHHFPPPSSHGHRTYVRHLDGGWWLEWDHWE